jgi:hypothetical protein
MTAPHGQQFKARFLKTSAAGIGLDELAEIIGDHWMSTLRGCAFEDLVSAGRAERNAADDYLKRRGWKESAGTRAYIEALRRSSMSLYEVSDIVGGVSFLARDLVRGGDPGAGWVPHLAPPRRSRRPCGPDASALVTALESHIKTLQGDTGSSKAIRHECRRDYPCSFPLGLSGAGGVRGRLPERTARSWVALSALEPTRGSFAAPERRKAALRPLGVPSL